MPICLGVYIEQNIIKYAKVSQEREKTKIEAFGVRIHDNDETTEKIIEQIVNETFSYKTPISSNITEEKYMYTDLFKLLNKKDLEKAADTEFEYYCNENGKKKQTLQYRHIFIDNMENKDKTTAMFIYTSKNNIAARLQTLDGYKTQGLAPVPIVLTNLLNENHKKNSIIVNIEKNTTVTTMTNGKVLKVDKINKGMQNILDNITLKESSYTKAYEICKNSTIYTTSGQNLQTEENEYLEDIMPTLYEIITEIKEIILNNGIEIENIFLTGLGTVINNIDLYFGENFENQKCEILVPYFIDKNNIKLNIKDYIEVNSAVSLALQGLNKEDKNVNFKNESFRNTLTNLLFTDVKKIKPSTEKRKMPKLDLKEVMQNGLKGSLDNTEWILIRIGYTLLLTIIIYIIGSMSIANMIKGKNQETIAVLEDTQNKITTVSGYTALLNSKTQSYQSMIDKIEAANNNLTEQYRAKNAVPNLLNNLMFAIPKQVKITLIENIKEKHIVIEAQSEKYEQLGYFVAKLKNDAILVNITATLGQKDKEIVKVTIEGDLPY